MLHVVDLDGDKDVVALDGSMWSRLPDYDGRELYAKHYVQRFASRRGTWHIGRTVLGYTGGMAQRAAPPSFLTVDEYLDLEVDSSIKHEYVEGALYALAGSSLRHNRIAINILRANGVTNVARELYVNALNFDNALAYRLS